MTGVRSKIPARSLDNNQPRFSHNSQSDSAAVPLHGGFENRQLDINYQKSIFGMLFLFQNTLLKFFDGGMSSLKISKLLIFSVSESLCLFLLEKCKQNEFVNVLGKLFGRMLTLEKHKQTSPKFTKSLSQLVKFLGI